LGETCWHGAGAGRRPVWLGNGTVLMVDEEDGGELPLGHPSQHLGVGSDSGSGSFHGGSSRRRLASGEVEWSRARVGGARW
jgi:hypothetical protein